MHFCVFLILFVASIRCQKPSEHVSRTTLLVEERVRRTFVSSPTAHPSQKNMTLQRGQTEAMSTLIRSFVSWERKWLDLASANSVLEMAGYLVLAVLSTLGIIFTPLIVLINLLFPSLAIVKRKRSVDHDEPHLDFSLPEWMDQMESWVKTHKSAEKRYRCCFYPKEPPGTGSARCFPLLPKYLYPWNNPCPQKNEYRDLTVGKDNKLH
ncbi:hypothetical protein DAPPUDRAFT_306338 [Daphnia pulex]|uniref:Uncharacterized protein n=1 Tax=Daphnia pulex TaxID=6669 RepID=E9GWZ6_DAPPU|nr:hypothetical protein DAPPUDRAFT_306338 [Daphnia pulex]|eukprot:EFX76025.1 hypothetical protein DAPPUDRAFT_306338 [Daphnia pulex]